MTKLVRAGLLKGILFPWVYESRAANFRQEGHAAKSDDPGYSDFGFRLVALYKPADRRTRLSISVPFPFRFPPVLPASPLAFSLAFY